MTGRTVLLVEDNPITRKMVRVALESEGCRVIEAGDGRSALAAAAERRPDLIILDYVLPDTDGMRLLEELRLRPGCQDLPALLVTGMVSRLAELRLRAGDLTQFLPKPIEPSRLLEAVRAHLSASGSWGGGRPLLVADDDPVNLKLAEWRLRRDGYAVTTAAGGAEALEKARLSPPAAILAHVGMPAMDGFALCREVRRDPALAGVPVILFSSAYLEEADHELARRFGANALVARSADLRFASEALREALLGKVRGAAGAGGAAAGGPGAVVEPELDALYRQRVQAQLERQTAQNRVLMRQAGIQATALALMRSLAEVLGQPTNVLEVIGDVLVQCLDAAGLSTGLIYLVEEGSRFRLEAQSGIPSHLRGDAETCFGHPELIAGIVSSGRPTSLVAAGAGAAAGPAALAANTANTAIDSGTGPPRTEAAALDFLGRLGRASALVVPFVVMGETFGVLVLASDNQDLSDSSWLGFAASLAVQFGQTVALGRSLSRLAASEQRYRALMEQAHDAILVLGADLSILEANRAALRLLDRPAEQIIGQSYTDFVPAEEQEESRRNREVLGREGSVQIPLRHLLRADGSRVAVEVSASIVRIGEDTTVLVILHDITQRRQLEAQFQQAQRMESVGRLAGGVAHDFNNLLTLILGYGNLVLRAVADRPALARQVEAILHAGESAATLTRQLLAFSRRQVQVRTVVDVNALIVQLERMLRRLIGEDIELVTDLDLQPARVRADAGQVEQVLMNLVVNARDAMPGGGRLLLSTRNHPGPGQAARSPAPAETAEGVKGPLGPPPEDGVESPAAAAGDASQVVLEVSDSGSGIDPTVMPHIFEPFFTTKEEGKGTGLGLATVYGIVHQSGGRIEVDSTPGKGTTFTIWLPRTEELPTQESEATGAAGRGNETVLVTEDEAAIRSLARELLEEQGYLVLVAASADDALRLADHHAGPIHLLLTDLVMPGRSGVELAKALSARRPGLRVVYMSGYADSVLPPDAPGVSFVQKPFDPGLLARRVRAVLDQR